VTDPSDKGFGKWALVFFGVLFVVLVLIIIAIALSFLTGNAAQIMELIGGLM